MAHVFPALNDCDGTWAGNPAEFETVRALARHLNDGYTLFHRLHWTREFQRGTQLGELDLVIVNRAGRVLFIEQKNGALTVAGSDLVKHYGADAKSVIGQVHRAFEAIKQKFKSVHPREGALDVDYLLYFPDWRAERVDALGLSAERVVDAPQRERLAERVEQVLGEGEPDPRRAQRVRDFVRGVLALVPNVAADLVASEATYERIVGGLPELVTQLEFAPWRLRVSAPAGAGKTQAALTWLGQRAGGRRAFICFNRAMAEGMAVALADSDIYVNTLHGLCLDILRAAGERPDPAAHGHEPGFWDDVVLRAGAAPLPEHLQFDVIAVDEGQDFVQEWWELLRVCLTQDGEVLWLEDPDQDLWVRPPVELTGFARYRVLDNWRSAQAVARTIGRYDLAPDVRFRSPVGGSAGEVHACADEEAQRRSLDTVLQRLRALGFKPRDIAVVTLRSMRDSFLGQADQLAGIPVRRFTGRYDAKGNQVMSDGELLVESILRFKGHQAPAVVLVDVPVLPPMDDNQRRRLYCGLTRASLRVDILVRKG